MFCILRSVVLKQFRKSVGLCQTLYKYRRDIVKKLYYTVKNDCLALRTDIFCISVFKNHKSIITVEKEHIN